MTRTNTILTALCLLAFLVCLLVWSFAADAQQMLEVPSARPTPTPALDPTFPYHYRCWMDPDGTTVNLKAIEGGPAVEFSCVNCRCDKGAK